MVYMHELREQIEAAAAEGLSIDDLDRWLGRNAWNASIDSADDVAAMVARAELLIWEYQDGVRSESNVRDALLALLGRGILPEK